MSRTKLAAAIAILMLCASLCRADAIPKGPEALKAYPGCGFVRPATDADSTLSYDDGIPQYYFPLPDEFDDHYFNVRFTAPDSCRLLQAAFLFIRVPGDTISTLPDLHVLVWPGAGLLPAVNPAGALDSVIIADEDVVVCANDTTLDTMFVSLEALDLHFADANKFHVGWEPDSTDSTDGPLAILSDDGIPSTNYSCEWWGGDVNEWGTMQSDWGLGVNFMIRVLVELYETAGLVWLDPDQPVDFALAGPYPNPFNPSANFQIQLQKPQEVRLQAYDLAGRLVDQIAGGVFPTGRSIISWQPAGLGSGTYLVVLKSAEETTSVRAVLVK